MRHLKLTTMIVNSNGKTTDITPRGKSTEPYRYISVGGAVTLSKSSRRILLITVGVIFCVVLCACGGSGSSGSSPTMKSEPTISWSSPGAIIVGNSLSGAELDATANVPGTFSYSPGSGTVESAAGAVTLSVTFTPTDTTNYNSATDSVTLTVNKATPVITWANPVAIAVGTALGSAQLDATANVPGSLAYSPAAGTVESAAGTVSLSVAFSPTDTADYSPATDSVSLQVGNLAYAWQHVQIVGGGYIDGLYYSTAESGLMYARTDIGGAYRWSPGSSAWVPLLDWVSPSEWWYGGVEAIGLDPTDANRLYLAVGEYASPSSHSYDGNGAILVSDNQGQTFTTIPLTFQNGSNDNGRNAGERFAVDPNSPNIVYFGSRTAGLQISLNHGASWENSTGLPVTTTANGSGVISVLPIALTGSSGAPTPVVYAAVAGTGVTSSGSTDPVALYVTTNGGSPSSNWIPVIGQPSFSSAAIPLAPLHAVLGPNGAIYVLYADQPGPSNITTSQLWEFTPTAGTWTSGTWHQILLPPNPAGNTGASGFGGIAVDPNQDGVLVVSTIDQYYPGDTLYRSTNDGVTWTDISRIGGTHSTIGAPWIGDFSGGVGSGNWVGSVVINPFNSAQAMYGTGAMLWRTNNLTAADSGGSVAWNVAAQGIEETAVKFTLAPPSGPTILLSSMGDIYGFAHQTLTASPSQGMYKNPMTEPSSMDFEQNTPTTVVRVSSVSPFGVASADGGLTWTPFASAPSGTTVGAGSIAIASDGSSLVWAPADTSSVWYSTNSGNTWSVSSGVPAQATIVSDRIKAGIYYAFSGGSLYMSDSSGAVWTQAQSGLPVYNSSCGLPSGGQLVALPDASGDIWLIAGTAGLWHNTGTASIPSLSVLTSITDAYAFGFGAPAPGSTQLTLYAYGTVAGITGLFRSTDDGSSWVQINSTTEQFGGLVQGVTGDMRSFGTVYVSTNGRGIFWGTSTN